MIMLCLDVGNSHIYGGLYQENQIHLRFRGTSKGSTSDELGLFLRQVLRENHCDFEKIDRISICSVVPQLDYSLRSACLKYFSLEPFFLQVGVKTGLDVKYRNPSEVGADRIANAIAATHHYPQKNLIIIDFGTATTFCAINAKKSYLGGAIIPGMRLSVEALYSKTAKLPVVEIVKPQFALGKSTSESIQSGVFFSVLGGCKEIIQRIKEEVFENNDPIILATGGFASLFEDHHLFHHHVPDLVLEGLRIAAELNPT